MPGLQVHHLRRPGASTAIVLGADVMAVQSMRCHARAAMKLDVSAGLLTADWTLPQSGSTRPLLSLVRTHCGLRRFYGFVHVLRRRVRRRLTCGFGIPDSPSTQHTPRGNFGGYDADRKPVSSANVSAKTSGGPRRARTDDLRIKRTGDTRSECWRSADSCVVR
jgi:hypothetical protein